MTTESIATHSTVDARQKALVNDLKSVVADTDDLLREVARSTVDEFAAARTTIEDRLSEARLRLGDARAAVAQTARGAASATRAYVRDNPWEVVGVAAAGLIIGYFISRR